jgi:hydrogenase maturation protease
MRAGDEAMSQRVLIAGIGNIFLQDDGFGVEVVRRLAAESLPEWVRVADFGIRGVHLAYDMLDGDYDAAILVDAAPRGEEPGTVYLIEPDIEAVDTREPVSLDAHGMDPQVVLQTIKTLGGMRGRLYIVGCEPLETEEGIGLSAPVSGGVEDAIKLVQNIVERLSAGNFNGELEVKGCNR